MVLGWGERLNHTHTQVEVRREAMTGRCQVSVTRPSSSLQTTASLKDAIIPHSPSTLPLCFSSYLQHLLPSYPLPLPIPLPFSLPLSPPSIHHIVHTHTHTHIQSHSPSGRSGFGERRGPGHTGEPTTHRKPIYLKTYASATCT